MNAIIFNTSIILALILGSVLIYFYLTASDELFEKIRARMRLGYFLMLVFLSSMTATSRGNLYTYEDGKIKSNITLLVVG